MGCCRIKSQTQEENWILKSEKHLGYQHKDCKEVDMVIRKYSNKGTINPSQLVYIVQDLDLNPEVHIKQYKILTDNSGVLKLRSLLIIGIMLSSGSPFNKAKLLFDVFDVHATDRIDLNSLKTEVFPAIVKESLNLCTMCNPKGLKLASYCNNLRSVQSDAIHRVLERIDNRLDDHIDSTRFSLVLADILDGSLTTAKGWRNYLHEVFLSMPHKEVFKNPFLSRIQNNS